MKMRTLLLLPLMLIPVLLTSASLLILQAQMQRQMRDALAADLRHSAATYRNLEQQRRSSLAREALLLSYQPSLRALMTTQDARTIQDEGGEYAQLSGADVLALISPTGSVVALYDTTAQGAASQFTAHIASILRARPVSRGNDTAYLFDGARLFQIAAQPVYLGAADHGSVLGYVVIGSLINDDFAREVSQTAGSEIAFAVGEKIISATLDANGRRALQRLPQIDGNDGHDRNTPVPLDLSRTGIAPVSADRFVVDRIMLGTSESAQLPSPAIALIVLRSMESFRRTQRHLNRSVLAIGAATLAAGVMLAFIVAHKLTSPLEGLASAMAAVGAGNYHSHLPSSGATEIRQLTGSIETMRAKIRETQGRLIEAERLATIGQMASSVSHDLRHYLASVYANAEFLASARLNADERVDLLKEIHLSVQGTTDLLDSLLLFSRTGRALHLTCESVTYLVERAVTRVCSHPEAENVVINLVAEGTGESWVDAKKVERAVYNVILNGCQAARRNGPAARVDIHIHEETAMLRIEVCDSGAGVPASIRDCLFDPFVSADKENGMGIGLTLAATIAQEHGGNIQLIPSMPGGPYGTVFVITLDREAARGFATGTVVVADADRTRSLIPDLRGKTP